METANFSQFRNATWEEWFDKITGTTQTLIGTAQDIKEQVTGNTPIAEGDLGGGFGDYTVMSGANADLQPAEERKSISPLIWGLIIVGAVGVLYFATSAAKKGKQ